MRSKKLSIAAILGLAVLTCTSAHATDWLGTGSGDWNTGGNWFGFSTPGVSDSARFIRNEPLVFRSAVNLSASTTVATMTVFGDSLAAGAYSFSRTNSAILTVNGLTRLGGGSEPFSTTTFNGFRLNTNNLTLNGGATGVLTGSGVVTSAGVVELYNSTRFTVNSGTLNAAGGINVNDAGRLVIESGGTLNMNTGTTMNLNGSTSQLQLNTGFGFSPGTTINTSPGADIIGTSYIDIGSGGANTVNLNGADSFLIAAGSTVSDWGLGASGSAVVNLSNGAVADVQKLNISNGTGAASINITSGAGLNVGQALTMGNGGVSRFIGMTINGGTLDCFSTANFNAFADVNLVSGTLRFRGATSVNAGGRIDITGGTLDTTGQTLTINGGTLTRTASGTALSNNSTLHVKSGGTATFSDYFDIGNGNAGALAVTGSGSTYTAGGLSDWGRGAGGTALVTIDTSGTANLSGLRIGTNNGAATVTVATGGQLKPNTLEVGGGSTARTVNLTINGGTVTVNDANSSTTFNDKAVLNLQAGTFDPKGNVTFFAGSTANWSGGTFLIGSGKTLTVSGGTINRTNTAASGLSPGATLAINSAGKFDGVGSYSIGEFGAGTVTITGTGSRLWGKSDLIIGGTSAGQVGTLTTSAGGGFLVGDNAAGFNNDVISIADNDPIASNAGGKLSILNGSVVTHTGDAVLASFAGTSGRLLVNGSGSLFKINGSFFASEGIAQMNIEAGGKIEMNFASLTSVPAGQSTTTVTGANSTLSSLGGLIVGTSGQATLNISSAGKVTAVNATLGSNASSVGTLNMNDTDSLLAVTGDLVVGSAGTGTVNHNAGALIRIGDNPSLTGGRIDIGDSNLAGNAGGNLRLANNSTFTTGANFLVGEGANRFGRLAVASGSTVTTTDKYLVGSFGTGRIEVTSGGKVNGLDMNLGDQTGGSGTLAISGTDSQVKLTRDVVIGSTSTGSGTVTIDGTNSRLSAGNNLDLRHGTLTITNGAFLRVGDNAVAFGSDFLDITDNNAIGTGQGGKLTITGGSVLNTPAGVLLAGLNNTSGELDISGTNSKLIAGGLLIVGNNGVGRVTVASGGLLKVGSYGITSPNGSKVILNTGGTFQASAPNANNALIDGRAAINIGYNGGNWLGNGITSTSAQTDTRLAVGYAVSGGTFTATVALKGDTDLSGAVNFDDLLKLAQNYNGTGKFWSDGDFNYDANVNFDDLLSLAQNYNQTLSVSQLSDLGSSFSSDWSLALSMVPEPTTAGLLLLGTPMIARRRGMR